MTFKDVYSLVGIFVLVSITNSTIASSDSPKKPHKTPAKNQVVDVVLTPVRPAELSSFPLDVLMSAEWKMIKQWPSCARDNIVGGLKDLLPDHARYVIPGEMVGDMYSGLGQGLDKAMGGISGPGSLGSSYGSESNEGWCHGQSIRREKIEAAIGTRIKLNMEAVSTVRMIHSKMASISDDLSKPKTSMSAAGPQ